ncbi:hypothetical protein L873DRAFT_1809012 [Choiromyces venosus 120613-1]|uniref:Secreted protein n=1 Tax=Choiromyces venosus 120613-1 TaxID=1336337 RepID=A0A3N4JI81_9PEZI|nr:hypothetical protein L873DRAFT_1809012 [Choiromyces venosus 120613-1]
MHCFRRELVLLLRSMCLSCAAAPGHSMFVHLVWHKFSQKDNSFWILEQPQLDCYGTVHSFESQNFGNNQRIESLQPWSER